MGCNSKKLTLLRNVFSQSAASHELTLARLRSEWYFCQKARFLAKMIRVFSRASTREFCEAKKPEFFDSLESAFGRKRSFPCVPALFLL